jgi:hypothetical protein
MINKDVVHETGISNYSNAIEGNISMCIYCGTNKYRRIYENHYGPIPKEENGRAYEIHHIDNNHSNNVPINLKCVSLQEHYDIHYAQGDWGACYRMAKRMSLAPNEIAEITRQNNKKMIEAGTHPFIGPSLNKSRHAAGTHPLQNPKNIAAAKERERVLLTAGTHLFLDKQWQSDKCKKAVINGNHNFLGGEIQRRTSTRRSQEGTHNLLRDNDPRIQDKSHHFFGGAIQRASNLKRLSEGTHPSQRKITCEHCEKLVSVGMHQRWHGNNCKNKTTKINTQ